MTKLPNDFQTFIHVSRYARWLEDEKRRESWQETVQRYIDNVCGCLDEETRNEAREAILGLETMPSMRALMTAGKALDRDNVSGYNCAYCIIDNQKAFDEAMYILLCGTGVGFSVERQYINKLPEIPELFESDTTIVVSDSKAGWAKALRQLIALLYSGEMPKWDVTRVRPAGARLKTFGGRASGPEPLCDLFQFVVSVFKKAEGRKLTSLECHDIMCKIGEVVVVGGVRRSAMISLSNLSDDRMRHAKDGQWWERQPQRALANNSVAYTEKPDAISFMREWLALSESGSGERGIFNRQASKKIVQALGRRDAEHDFGCNPCLHPDSMVETVKGRMRIVDITEPVKVYTMLEDGTLGIRQASAAFKTKENTGTLEIETFAGHVVRCTPNHKIFTENRGWVEAQNLRVDDTLVHLKRSRRGAGYAGVGLTSDKTSRRHQTMEHRLVWEGVYGKLTEGQDVHHINENTYDNSIDNLEALPHGDHASVTRYSCPNDHMKTGYHEDGTYGFISVDTGYKKPIKNMPEELKSNITNQYSTRVKSIKHGGFTDVYDLTVEGTHNFIADFTVVHNCSEIILRPYQFCNLTECVVRAEDTEEDLARKVRMATILGTVQSTLTKFPYLRKVWKDNTEEERLLGVSLTGIMDNKLTSTLGPELDTLLDRLRQVTIDTNKEFAEKLGIPQSTAITCVKPSGTVSQLVNSASGIHARYSKHYIRTVRGDVKDPLTQFMISKGIPNEKCYLKPDSTVVFSFPIKAPETSVVTADRTAIEQLEMWLTYQRHWCEHKPSVTISVLPEEWVDVGAFVYKHFDEMSGVSFLPFCEHTYKQAPYQEIDEAKYEQLLAAMPEDIDWSELEQYEQEDNTKGSQTYACGGSGSCEIVDIA